MVNSWLFDLSTETKTKIYTNDSFLSYNNSWISILLHSWIWFDNTTCIKSVLLLSCTIPPSLCQLHTEPLLPKPAEKPAWTHFYLPRGAILHRKQSQFPWEGGGGVQAGCWVFTVCRGRPWPRRDKMNLTANVKITDNHKSGKQASWVDDES